MISNTAAILQPNDRKRNESRCCKSPVKVVQTSFKYCGGNLRELCKMRENACKPQRTEAMQVKTSEPAFLIMM